VKELQVVTFSGELGNGVCFCFSNDGWKNLL